MNLEKTGNPCIQKDIGVLHRGGIFLYKVKTNTELVQHWKKKTTANINAVQRPSRESRFIKRFLLWSIIWIGGFIVEPLIAKLGYPYYSTVIGYSVLFVRDIVLAGISFLLWKNNFGKNSVFQRNSQGHPLSLNARLRFFSITAILTALYFAILVHNKISIPFFTLPKIFLLVYPLRIFTYVLFQQITNTLFLLDTCVERVGFKDGLFFASFMFGISHFGCMSINLSPEMTLGLSIVSGFAMYFWGSMRKKYNNLFYCISTHYVFWLILQLATTGMYLFQ